MNSRLSTLFGVYRWSTRRPSPKPDQRGSFSGGQPRFESKGPLFRAKRTGKKQVPDARGHRLCQDAMARLTEAVHASRQHKQRVQLPVSLQGITIRDEKTGELLFHHPVNRISFISQDTSDALAVAYIYIAQYDVYHYITIKTEKVAAELEVALVAPFQMVLDMKCASGVADQDRRHLSQAWARTTSTRADVHEGSQIRDERTGKLPFHHPVQQISFISQDNSDTRAAGYIYVAQDESYRYIGLKTCKEATEQDAALVAFLQMVLDMKDRAMRIVPQEWQYQQQAWKQATSTHGDVQEVISSSQDE
ncbi:hypothetical protein V5799_022119 [Amblyomma americanum]|uniref:PID domain-containing protein n=1 Tax=Amblyomma americanum TaxID=6943 RepID=A0AAQ4FN10_AMBAM